MAKNDWTADHPTEAPSMMTLLSVRPKPVQRSMPTDPAYDLQAIVAQQRAPVRTAPAPKVSETSMFFRFRGANLDQDPFLQRLSRLN